MRNPKPIDVCFEFCHSQFIPRVVIPPDCIMQRMLGVGRNSLQKITNSALVALSIVAIPALAWQSTSSSNRVLLSSSFAALSGSRLFSSAMSSDTCASSSGTLEVAQFPCLNDNYGFLIHDRATGQTAAVDTPESSPYEKELQKRGWTLTHIFNTHHHWDHVGGNKELKKEGVKVYGPAKEKPKIPGIDVALQDGDELEFGSSKVRIIEVGGHTLGHIAYYFPDEAKVFAGDSIFALGCGKMFEGTPSQFWTSLQKLRELPDDTLVYW
jgi:hypothetical protein